MFRKLVINALGAIERGTLTVVLPNGDEVCFGGLYDGVRARIAVRREAFFRKCALGGPIGFGEAYVDGDWETPDLVQVIALFILNADANPAMRTEGGVRAAGIGLLNFANRILHVRRRNDQTNSRRNIGEHYDLSNDFFRLWLDETMTYSSAYFDPPELALREAQLKKYDVLCRKLQIGADDNVLEIGTGWGGFALHAAATYGCRVTTVTISREQFAEATARVAAAGLADRVTVKLEDYRNLRGQFDRIVSIEMIEAVGDEFLDIFAETCGRLLRPNGLLGLQMITCPDRQFKILRDGVDFIQKHIFPGSLLVSQGRMAEAFQRTGWLNLFDWEDMGMNYAKTLRLWYERFDAVREDVLALGFDERFLRKWRYYLNYCEAAFGTRHISVVHGIYTRPNNLALASDVYALRPERSGEGSGDADARSASVAVTRDEVAV